VLSLVLLQSRSYGDIASLLRLGESDVRERAHAAAGQLVPADGGIGAETRARIVDYMLGEQTVSARAQTRSELQSSDLARKWAAQLAAGLAPLAKSPLPSIPEPPGEAAPVEATPAAVPVKSATPARPRTEPVEAAGPVAPVKPAAPARRAAPPRPVPSRPAPPKKLGRVALAGGVALIAIVALVVVLATSGGGSNRSTTAATTSATSTAVHAARTIEKLVLQPTGSNRSALGAGAVVRQKDGSLLLLVQARGLTPNSEHNAYAVWLVNSSDDAHLLGFVKPAVGSSGTFSSGAPLPSDASRFHSLVLTIERSSQPTSPGPAVLRSPLSLP
jgi:hypothetical protein